MPRPLPPLDSCLRGNDGGGWLGEGIDPYNPHPRLRMGRDFRGSFIIASCRFLSHSLIVVQSAIPVAGANRAGICSGLWNLRMPWTPGRPPVRPAGTCKPPAGYLLGHLQSACTITCRSPAEHLHSPENTCTMKNFYRVGRIRYIVGFMIVGFLVTSFLPVSHLGVTCFGVGGRLYSTSSSPVFT